MGRNEAPLERDGTPAVELAFWLRELRRRASLTYPEIAAITNYAASSLQGACSGRRLPSKKITLAIVAACDGDLSAWSGYWSQLRRASTEPSAEVRPPWLGAAEDELAATAEAETAETGTVRDDTVRADDVQFAALDRPARAVEPPAVVADPNGDLPIFIEQSRSASSIRRHRAAWLGSVAASFAVGILVGHQFVQGSPNVSRDATAAWAKESGRSGAPSLADPRDGTDPGPGVPYGQPVQLTCELRLGADDDWYLVASQPWRDQYYTPAADFAPSAVSVPAC
jgi:hypothetical protein